MGFTARFTLVVLSTAACFSLANGQDGARYKIEQNWTLPATIRADLLYRTATLGFANASFDPAADSLLQSADRFTRAVFQLSTLTLNRSVTSRDDEGDTILAEWTFKESSTAGSLILRDTPFISQYFFHITGYPLGSAQDIDTLLARLLVLSKPPTSLTLPSLRFTVTGGSPIQGFSGTLATPKRANEFLMEFSILGASVGSDLYMAFRLGKQFTLGYYPLSPYVMERFPPLTELVPSWASARIRQELGQGSPDGALIEFRDQILLTELVKRGVSQELFLDLLSNPGKAALDQRAALLIQTMKGAGQGGLVQKYFMSALSTYERIGSPANEAVLILFRAALPSCPSGVHAEIAKLFSEGTFQNAALSYFEHCSSSIEDLSFVQSTDVPSDLLRRRDSVVRSIRDRLEGQGVPFK